jgi:isopentenyl diphosphate isomerase/L-lactate dehydrogenase-like FMN-dependent dehydrogenase
MTRRDAFRHLSAWLAASPILHADTALEDMVNVFDFDLACKSKVPQPAYDYISGGGWDEWTLARNRDAFREITFRPRFFRRVDQMDLSTEVLGQRVSAPIFVAPTGTHGIVHTEAEIATVRGAGAADTLMVVSTSSSVPIDKIAAEAKAPLWFQLYTGPDLESTRERVTRAVEAGCRVIVLTVDAPYNAPRERDQRNRLVRSLPEHRSRQRVRPGETPATANYGLPIRFQAELEWNFLDKLISYAGKPVLVKGILTAEDAVLAIEHGAAGIVVSNHGGRYLDSDPATIEVLPEIIRAVRGRVPVLIDGGFRRGTDVLKALAIGAKAVLVGRPPLWGLGAFGADGVRKVLELLRRELAHAMALAGRPNIASIDSSLIRIGR